MPLSILSAASHQFSSRVRCIIGEDTLSELADIAESVQAVKAVLIISSTLLGKGWDRRIAEKVGIPTVTLLAIEDDPGRTSHEPTREDALSLTDRLMPYLKQENIIAIGLGGGSVMDLAKLCTIAAIMGDDANTALSRAYRGDIPDRPFPLVLIPSTSGAGAEMTDVTVLSVPKERMKRSVHAPSLSASHAIIDPAVAVDVPKTVYISSGMDALVQAIESYSGRSGTPLSRALAADAFRIIMRYLPLGVKCGVNDASSDARSQIHYAATMAGLAIANSGCGAAHGLANPIGGATKAAHGMINGILLPHVIRANAESTRPEKAIVRKRYAELSGYLPKTLVDHTGKGDWLSLHGVILDLAKDLNIPQDLVVLGAREEDIGFFVSNCRTSSYRNNQVPLDDEELTSVLKGCINS
ncbi:MAG: iron-containing alcohol dehydrogenase [archaeon]